MFNGNLTYEVERLTLLEQKNDIEWYSRQFVSGKYQTVLGLLRHDISSCTPVV